MQTQARFNTLALLWLVLGLLTMGVMLQAFAAVAQNQVLAAKAAQRHKAELANRVTDCLMASPWELRASCKAQGRVETTTVAHRSPGFDRSAVQTASLK